jgi:DNA-binding LytR/AlgR family response regulator
MSGQAPRGPEPSGHQRVSEDVGGLRALVVDDELPGLEELSWLLRQDPRIKDVRTAGSGAEALRALEQADVDVVFSDISMPGLDGMDLARVIARFAHRPQVVFVTAHDQHAVDAFAVEAAEAVRRVVAAADPSQPKATAEPTEPEDETIAVELGGVTRFINRTQIRYAQAQGDYARLHTDSGSHLVRIPLTTLEERWGPAGFVRIHRSTLVSLPHVREIRMEHGRCTVVLEGAELQVSRRHTRELRDRLLRPPKGTPA